ncbi:MAG: DNA-directed RNA polymerase subunit omega [Dysgonamonadaceae bacterium]|jgi:DNA-directed RNA polymerase subunit K/omega|nr:DNA-directed RNA polymerase subunit omega [Dysgonamonadaceae bacterium]
MDYKKNTVPDNTVTRDLIKMAESTGNVYELVRIIGKRANEISVDLKQELSSKLQEFSSSNDSLEEIFENREQIEISRYFERLPKPTLVATQEFLEGEIYYRNPDKDKEKLEFI